MEENIAIENPNNDSLVAYSLGITDVDPLQYNLFFERFLNPERITMPDIDIDFLDVRREEVISYLKEKYGCDRVSHVLAFSTFKVKQALRDVCKVHGLDSYDIDAFLKSVPDSMRNDTLQDIYEKNTTFKNYVNNYNKFKNYQQTLDNLQNKFNLSFETS